MTALLLRFWPALAVLGVLGAVAADRAAILEDLRHAEAPDCPVCA